MTRRALSWLQLRSPAQVARLVMVTYASSALQTIADTSPHLQSGHFSLYSLLPPTCHRGAAVAGVLRRQELGGGAGLYWYWQWRGHLTLQLPCTARTLTDSHHQENCTLGLRPALTRGGNPETSDS